MSTSSTSQLCVLLFAFFPKSRGSTPLIKVSGMGDVSLKVLKLLLDRGADVNAENFQGSTALSELLMGPPDLQNAQALVRAGACTTRRVVREVRQVDMFGSRDLGLRAVLLLIGVFRWRGCAQRRSRLASSAAEGLCSVVCLLRRRRASFSFGGARRMCWR